MELDSRWGIGVEWVLNFSILPVRWPLSINRPAARQPTPLEGIQLNYLGELILICFKLSKRQPVVVVGQGVRYKCNSTNVSGRYNNTAACTISCTDGTDKGDCAN